MIPTPDLSHLTSKDYDLVYEPAEDTFLLLDAFETQAGVLRELQPKICLEIGSGSGCVSAFLASILGPSSLYFCTDINPYACTCTRNTGTQNKVVLDCINASFAKPLMLRLRHSVDVIVFNPPYVPTLEDEAEDAQNDHDIRGSWAGGQDGMSVTNLFLQDVETLLSSKGFFFLVALKDNDIPSIQNRMLQDHGLQSKIILQRRAGREHLFILQFERVDKAIALEG
ncbi:S-adenosyl-L-methionine-dependent methyltransferase [Pluteus cervinus]|uniref:S-adenosyl-L-methionine-dependent methyltransferase n=1 Tax=Pluteus cervinus TaxID=181527 RepID=A0ACD3BFV2_9AGAR|nr:S-adenosyl-L-methionine-dependent methyltransferase [Pluteus cervinus]